MTYTTLAYGSKGDSVRSLQKALTQAGYALEEDGIFGDKTSAALKSYQQKNALTVDGIAGEQTWKSLEEKGYLTAGETVRQYATPLAETENSRPQYVPSQELKGLEEQLKDYTQKAPGVYESTYEEELDALIKELTAAPPFSYDLTGDPLYDQYTRQYQRQGQRAMEESIARASELTGGYASSYAATAGSAAYNEQLQNLAEIAPELYQLALDRYLAENKTRLDKASLLQNAEKSAYQQYRDQMEDYFTGLELLMEKQNALSKEEYDRYLDELNGWRKDRQYEYEKQMDLVTQSSRSSSSGRTSTKKTGSSSQITTLLKSTTAPVVSVSAKAQTKGSDTVIKDIITKLKQTTK